MAAVPCKEVYWSVKCNSSREMWKEVSVGLLASASVKRSSLYKHKYIFYMFQCQTAALDELFGNPGECFQRYQTAQILLHSLSQQVNHQQDRALLTKCKCCILLLICKDEEPFVPSDFIKVTWQEEYREQIVYMMARILSNCMNTLNYCQTQWLLPWKRKYWVCLLLCGCDMGIMFVCCFLLTLSQILHARAQ
jgi:hypothetical protein